MSLLGFVIGHSMPLCPFDVRKMNKNINSTTNMNALMGQGIPLEVSSKPPFIELLQDTASSDGVIRFLEIEKHSNSFLTSDKYI